MTTWLFAATAKQACLEKTFELAADAGLIVRPYFDNRKDNWRSRNHNSAMKENDNLILAFVEDGLIIGSASFTLSPKTPRDPGTKLSDHLKNHKSLLQRQFPSVFSVYPSDYQPILDSEYGESLLDPKLRVFVCLSVVSNDIAINEEVLQLAYSALPQKKSTLNPISDECLEIRSVGATQPILRTDIEPVVVRETVQVKKKLQSGRLAIGIDFSGGRAPADKIWLAEIISNENRCLELHRLENGFSFDALQNEISQKRSADILIDFPFGLARQTCINLSLPINPTHTQIWARVAEADDAQVFRLQARANQFGPGSERDHKRNIDRQLKTPFAPINLRMFRQTFFGQAVLLHPALQNNPDICFLPWAVGNATEGQPRIGEGCPASMLKQLGWPSDGYKGNTDQCQQMRCELLQRATQAFNLLIPSASIETIASDVEGDAIDALLLAIAAAHLSDEELEAGKLHCENHPSEGYIYLGTLTRPIRV